MNTQYSKEYSESSFWKKLKKYARQAGIKVVYIALLLYYVLTEGGLPPKMKLLILSALGYFILPSDLIPDLVPLIGFSDDLGALILALSQIWKYVTPEIKAKARAKVSEWFATDHQQELDDLESSIEGEKKSQT